MNMIVLTIPEMARHKCGVEVIPEKGITVF